MVTLVVGKFSLTFTTLSLYQPQLMSYKNRTQMLMPIDLCVPASAYHSLCHSASQSKCCEGSRKRTNLDNQGRKRERETCDAQELNSLTN
jgi:hypothetical protein